LAIGVHLQTWATIIVPRTEGDEITALAAKLHVTADELDDVHRLADLLFRVECGAETHNLRLPLNGTNLEN
jgi:hypothetical protein